jgi:hypothetical protein
MARGTMPVLVSTLSSKSCFSFLFYVKQEGHAPTGNLLKVRQNSQRYKQGRGGRQRNSRNKKKGNEENKPH